MRIEAGALIGRYVVMRKLGAGGMGAVYAAYDPELDRRIAIKVLLPRPGRPDRQARRQARLLREAQAMARLSHPNVVAVHDVGTIGDQVYVAMAFVEGRTLREALEDGAGSLEWILDVFGQAGRGLAAAHREGFVHRDFKPENVMIGSDGRAFVMDFGLVRADEAVAPVSSPAVELPPEVSTSQSSRPLASNLTRVGAMIGTPAYMAPEQFLGHTVTVRSDQFAFCISLWEAIYGERPFAGRTVAEIGDNVVRGRIRAPSKGRRGPRWLRRILERGLEVDPDHRFPDMDALLSAIDRGRRRRTYVRVAAGLAAVVAAGIGWKGYERLAHARMVAGCEAEGERIAEVWNDAARDRVRAGILATGTSYAPQMADHLVPVLDGIAEEIGAAQAQACLARDVDRTASAAEARKTAWCLAGARTNFETLTAELSQADAELADVAVDLAADLAGAAAACTNGRLLAHMPDPPEDADPDVVAGIRRVLTTAAIFEESGEYDDALSAVDEALERAEALGWAPLAAEARSLRGLILRASGKTKDAEAAFTDAYFEAARSGAWGLAGETATRMAFALVVAEGDPDRAELWLRNAEMAFEFAGVGTDDSRWSDVLTVRGIVENYRGNDDAAMALWREALDVRKAALGAEHPSVGALLNNMATVNSKWGRNETAMELYDQVYALWGGAYGSDNPSVAMVLLNRSVVEMRVGKLEQAREDLETALRIYERARGPKSRYVLMTLQNLGSVHAKMGDYAGARRAYGRALALVEELRGPDDPDVGVVLADLGDLALQEGNLAEARRLHERALALMEKAGDPKNTLLAYPLTALAKIALAEGRPADAIAPAERAAKLRKEGKIRPEAEAESRFALARALWHASPSRGGDRARAVEEARTALALYDRSTARVGEARTEVAAWLAARGPAPSAGEAEARPANDGDGAGGPSKPN